MDRDFINAMLVVLCIALALTGLVKLLVSFDRNSDEQVVANTLHNVETLTNREYLKRIKDNQGQINKLVAVCIRNITPPIHLSEMQTCNDQALKYIGIPHSYAYVVQKASAPLKEDLVVTSKLTFKE